MIRVPRSIVPNVFTVANMFCGYMAIVFALYSHQLILSAWLVVLAAFLDTLDGKIARITRASSKFGVEYDSLADLISFGMAPSALVYSYYFSNWGTVGLFISFFPLLFASLRLARFNVQLEGFDKNHFTGLPSPAAANTLTTYVIFFNEFLPHDPHPKFLLSLTLIVGLLMVSNVRYEVMPHLTLKGSFSQKLLVMLIVAMVITLIFFPQALFFTYTLLYVASGPVRWLSQLGNGQQPAG